MFDPITTDLKKKRGVDVFLGRVYFIFYMTKYSKAQAKKDLPVRKASDNKTRGGKCLVIAGSKGMWGAATLTAEACARVGAGYVYLNPTSSGFPTVKHPDFLINTEKNFSKFQAIAIGPGGKPSQMGKWIKKALKCKTVVLDAEALNYLAKTKIKLPTSWILTPHEGELSRLINVSSSMIKKDRVKYLKIAQKKYGCIILLKGHRTLIADAKNIFEIQSGNPALAKAGTGDVLTGIILGFLSQKLDPIKAACLGSFIHGYIADQWIKKNDILSLVATDLIKALPSAIKKLR